MLKFYRFVHNKFVLTLLLIIEKFLTLKEPIITKIKEKFQKNF